MASTEEADLELEYATSNVPATKLSRYEEIRGEAEVLYKKFLPVKCPALNGHPVIFTSEGFNHIVYRMKKQERNRSVQILRFELLEKGRQLLEKVTVMQEYEQYPKAVEVRRFKQKTIINQTVTDIGFVGIIKGFRIKVVVRKIGNGAFQFHSIIPAWSTKYYRDIKIVRNTKGNVADD